MKYIRSFGRFCWDFIVGDDWRVAVGLAVAFAATWLLSHYGISSWWVLPPAVALLLAESVWREAGGGRHGRDRPGISRRVDR